MTLANVVPNLRIRQVLLLQLRLVFRLTAPEVLLLDLVEALPDVGIGDLDPHRVRLLLALGLLDEQRDGLALDRLVVRGAGFREDLRRSLRRIAPLRLGEECIERGLAHMHLPDRRDVARIETRTTPAAPSKECRKEDKQQRNFELFHKKTPAKPPGARPA